MNKNDIVIEKRDVYIYPKISPFRPSKLYPETPFNDLSLEDNKVYDMVRSSFYLAGYDKENFGTIEWNPLKNLINPGETVLLKPNLVMDVNGSGDGTDCLYTNPSLVAAVLDYVYIALKGKGKIIVGDAPMQECNFDKLINESGYKKLIDYCKEKFKGIDVELIDFRDLKSDKLGDLRVYHVKDNSDGVLIDLGEDSEFSNFSKYNEKNIRIPNYDPNILREHHNSKKHEYCINSCVLNADVIINMPKPKTHRKAGVTIALKNLVGINAKKEYLPHHTKGSVCEGGDEYKEKSKLKRIRSFFLDKKNIAAQGKNSFFHAICWQILIILVSIPIHFFIKDKYDDGSWYGNNTINKTILDLNKILFYADKKGNMQNDVQRKYLIIADMIVSGEKEGPVSPSPKEVGIVALGQNPVIFDTAIAKLMGADVEQIPTLEQFKNERISKKYEFFKMDEVAKIVSNDNKYDKCKIINIPENCCLHFLPTSGWKGVFNSAE